MASADKSQLLHDLRDILRGADLDQLSSKKVRKKLEAKYGEDLTARKKEIDELMMTVMKEVEEASKQDNNISDKSSGSENSDSEFDEETDAELAQRLQDEEENSGKRRTRGRASRKSTPSKRSSREKTDKPARASGYMKQKLLSPILAKIVGTDRLSNHEVVKKLWAIAKERDLFVRRRRVRMFGCMKYLGTHMHDEEQQLLD